MPLIRCWARHPWVGWWLALALLVYSPPSPPPILRIAHWIAAAVWCASLVQGLRVTARRSPAKAGVIGVALFVPDLVPMLAAGGVRLLEHALGVTLPRGRLDPSLGLLGGVVALALLTEYSVHAVARGRPTAAVAVAPPPRDAAGTRRLIRAARGLGAVGLGLGLLFASMVVKIGWAKQQTHALCAGIVVGEPVEELTAKARRRGLVVWSSPEGKDIDGRPRPAMLMAWEGFAFGRWFCDVEHAQGRVLSRRTAFLG